jgi:hypothetical protein
VNRHLLPKTATRSQIALISFDAEWVGDYASIEPIEVIRA